MSTQTLTARIDSNILQQARDIAQTNGISLSAIVNIKLREFIANQQLQLVDPEVDVDFGKGVDAREVLDFLKAQK